MARIPVVDTNQKDELWMDLIDYFAKYNLFDLVERAINQLIDKTLLKALFYKAQIQYFKGNF